MISWTWIHKSNIQSYSVVQDILKQAFILARPRVHCADFFGFALHRLEF